MHECLWNGPSWPFGTTQTLNALANLLKNYQQDYVSEIYSFTFFARYTNSHYHFRRNGERVNWLDENLDPFTGIWLSRDILQQWGWRQDKGGFERGKDYNHSAYVDIIISKIWGLEPQKDGSLQIRPMIPPTWEYACIEHLQCLGHEISLYWDQTGTKYPYGKGFHVVRDENRAVKVARQMYTI